MVTGAFGDCRLADSMVILLEKPGDAVFLPWTRILTLKPVSEGFLLFI